MNAVHKARLLKLADFLETQVPPERFDMATIASAPDGEECLTLEPECGTSACALEWATVVFPRSLSLEWVGGHACVLNRRTRSWGWSAAQEFFGLTPREAGDVFGITPSTPEKKARQIRRLVKDRGTDDLC